MYGLTKFLGMEIAFCDDKNANNAHVHVKYESYDCVMDIASGGVMSGTMPPRVASLAAEWVTSNKQILTTQWQQWKEGKTGFELIAPLV